MALPRLIVEMQRWLRVETVGGSCRALKHFVPSMLPAMGGSLFRLFIIKQTLGHFSTGSFRIPMTSALAAVNFKATLCHSFDFLFMDSGLLPPV